MTEIGRFNGISGKIQIYQKYPGGIIWLEKPTIRI